MEANPDAQNAQDIEDLFDGNICRCTGYRPILDAMKSFADDAPKEVKERLSKLPHTAQRTCPITQRKCLGPENTNDGGCSLKGNHAITGSQNTAEGKWLFPKSLNELMNILKALPDPLHCYRLVAGNTGTGAFAQYYF